MDEFDNRASEKEIKALDDLARGDSKMKLCISNNVSLIASQISSLGTAKEMCHMIANQYERSEIVLNQQAIVKYTMMRCSDFSNIDEYIRAFQNAIDTLNRVDIEPPDSWHPLVFLEAAKEYFPMRAERQQGACRGKERITLNEFIHDRKEEARADPKNIGG